MQSSSSSSLLALRFGTRPTSSPWLGVFSSSSSSSIAGSSRLIIQSRKYATHTHYDVLKLPRTAGKREIKNKFYELSKKSHPDIPGGDRAKFERLSEAYNVLGNDQKRRQYDSTTFSAQHSSGSSGGPNTTYSARSPYLRRNGGGTSGPHRAWGGGAAGSGAGGPSGGASTRQRERPYPEYHYASGTRRPGTPPPGFGSASHHFKYNYNYKPAAERKSTYSQSNDPDASDKIRNESGLGRFIGILVLLMFVIALGGGFTVRADETVDEATRQAWRDVRRKHRGDISIEDDPSYREKEVCRRRA